MLDVLIRQFEESSVEPHTHVASTKKPQGMRLVVAPSAFTRRTRSYSKHCGMRQLRVRKYRTWTCAATNCDYRGATEETTSCWSGIWLYCEVCKNLQEPN